jgi:mono/diheme cytochrome c family protein
MQCSRRRTGPIVRPRSHPGRGPIAALVAGGCLAAALSSVESRAQQTQPDAAGSTVAARSRAVLDQYCVGCHNQRLRTAGLALDTLDVFEPAARPDAWELVIGKLRAGSMPPPGRPRPDAATYHAVTGWLETEIDRAWAANPNPVRTSAVHRLNRTEYANAIRDLFAIDRLSFDVVPLLPGDETADGSFDNFADALSISTAHLERYLSVARQITRLATGLPPEGPRLETFEIPLHVMQDDRQNEDLPFGSRGGIAIHYSFPVDGEYLIQVRLQRQYQDYLKGMGWPQQLDVRLDGRLLERFTVGGGATGRAAAASYAGDGEPGFAGDPEWETYMQLTGDAGLEIRMPVTGGPHLVGVSFVRELWEPEGLPHPLQRGRVIANDQVYMGYANVGAVSIGGPYRTTSPATDTPSRRSIFVCDPAPAAAATSAASAGGPRGGGARRELSEEQRGSGDGAPRPPGNAIPRADERCATTILSRIARLAYRRPVTDADVRTLLDFFEAGRRDGGTFDAGVQFALERMLVDPDFLLRIHRDPPAAVGAGSGRAAPVPPAAYRLSDLDVASRLSFFLWSSIPDERLLELAEGGQLTDPPTLDREVRRMLADPRAVSALVDDFAAQWLNLRRIEEVVVDPEVYPNYDESLLKAFQRETALFVASTLREDRSVLDLLRADYTFVNERLARHYGLPGIYGSRFRRVTLPNPDQRGGVLGQGALLATTSYPERTSPVLRGKFLLNNIFGLPVPPPPAGVDTNLGENTPGAAPRPMRERLAAHRSSPSCASCHAIIDPLGFALENFDVIGGWRTMDESGTPIDASGTTLGGARVEGLAGLRALLLEDPERFPRTVTEKLLAYALGRPLDYSDRPALRRIVRDAAVQDYRWSALVRGIVESPAFLMRTRAEAN